MKAWKSGVWVMSGQVVSIAVNLATLAILGRILTPAEFGLFGIVLAMQALILPLIDMGLKPAYIKLDRATAQASNVFFSINVYIGCLISLVFIIVTPELASFYESDKLGELSQAFAASIFLTAMNGQASAVLMRNKRFDQLVLIDMSVFVTGAALSVLLAWKGYGVWALIYRAVYESAVKLALLLLVARCSFRLVGFSKVKPYLQDVKFGLEIILSRFVGGWVKAIDKLVLAKFVSMDVLGGYTRSQQLALMPDANIRTSITSPALAYLARKKNGPSLDDYIMLNWVVFLFAGTPCLVLIAFGDRILPAFLGNQWVELGWILQWMGLFGLARVFQGMATVYHVDRKVMKRNIAYTLISIVTVLSVPLGLLFGLYSIDHFVRVISILSVTYWFFVLLHTMTRDWSNAHGRIFRVFAKFFAIGVVSVMSALYLRSAVVNAASLSELILGIILQILITLGMFILINSKEVTELWRMVWGNR